MNLFKAEDILHVVKSGLLVFQPEGSTNCTRCKSHSGRGFVSEFESLTFGGKHDGVIADHVTPAKGVHADFTGRAGPGVSEAAVDDVVFV